MDPLKNSSVSIVILNWNCVEDTLKCLDSLKLSTYENVSIQVIDNGSKEDEGSVIKSRYPEVILTRVKTNQGFVGGSNIGIEKAILEGATYILLLNSDTVVDKDAIGEMVAAAESDQEIAAVGSKVFFMENPKILMHFGLFVDLSTSHIVSDGYDTTGENFREIKEYDFVGGCCILLRTSVVKEIGLLDKRFFAYFEETDWCFRAKEKGYKIVGTPLASIWHKVPYPPIDKRGAFQQYLVTRNRLLFTKKHYGGSFVWYVIRTLKSYFILPVLKSIKQRSFNGLKSYLFAYWDYFRGNWGFSRKKSF